MHSSPDQPANVAPPPPTTPPPPPPPRQRGNGQRVAIGITVVVVLASAAVLGFPRIKDGLGTLVSEAGTSDWDSLVAYSREGDEQLGDLRVGTFNYVNACDVYTAEHYEAAGLGTAPYEVTTTFATRTYGDEDPLRTYENRCSRDPISIEIDQFSDKAHQGKAGALLKGFEPSDEYARVLGESAMYRSDLNLLMFEVDNKRVTVSSVSDVGSQERQQMLEVARAVKQGIEQRASQPSQVLDYSPKGMQVGQFPYRSACDLFTPGDYRDVVGIEPDAGAIEATYAEQLPRSTEEVTSTCTIHALGPKTSEVDSADLQPNQDFVDQIVTLEVRQYDTIRWAREFFGRDDAAPEQIKGADDAYLDSGTSGAGDTVQTLHVLKDNVDFWLQVNHLGFGGTTAESDLGADQKVLKRLARTIVRRLD